jgi:tetratricopeptide (TPR) repeat protein
MGSHDGTDPALLVTPVPLEGDGAELIGMVVDGRYRLEATLGRGGMGLVFRATHLRLRKPVAVKILHPSFAASPDVRSRFDREKLAAGKIRHPNCVETYDSGQLSDGSLYLAMELLDGRSLADILEREGQVAPGRALHILAHVLRGLGSIHDAGLIHRDIKPENIFLIRHGEDEDFAKILDFGIAKPMSGEIDDGVRLTQAGMAFGTPIYMAPEQALGNPMDGRADLYAAAVLAYEMLCGQPPFYSEDKLEVMSMHTARPVPPMRTRLIKRGKPVPASVERLIVRGLTKKPADRYANAAVFLAAVEGALTTSDGGVTDVAIELLEGGSEPLVGEDGEVRLADAAGIETAIQEALAGAPAAPRPTPTYVDPPSAADRSGRVQTKLGVAMPDPPVVASGEAQGRAGVGIGLPYTGPNGEPIFGLTPEERLAQVPKKSKKLAIYIGLGAVAAAVGIGIAIWTKPSSPKLDPESPAGQAQAALDRGQYEKAIQILSNAPTTDQDPDALLVLGAAYTDKHDRANALNAYRRALALEPSVGDDKTMRAALREDAADADPGIVENAFDLWVATGDPEAKRALAKAAVVSDDIKRRRAAQTVAQKLHLGNDDIDWVASYGYDLQRAITCEERREAVRSLRGVKDPRAINVLESAISTKAKRKFNACLETEANAAIGFLRSLKK